MNFLPAKQLVLIFLCVLAAFIAAGQNNSANIPVYTIAFDKELEPYEFLNKDNKADGISPAILREIEKSANVKFEFIPMTWSEALDALERGQVDLVSMISTPEREALYYFSKPFSHISQALFRTEAETDITNLNSLKGHKIGFQEQDVSLKRLEGRTDFEKVIFHSKLDAMLNVNIGEIDGFFCAQEAGFSIISKYDFKNIDLASGELFTMNYAFATRKGNRQLIEMLNINLNKLKASGKLEAINQKWLSRSKHLPDWLDRNRLVLLMAGIFLGVALILLVFWNRSLTFRVNRRTKSLQESGERLNKAQKIAHLGSWELDIATGKLTWSDEVFRIFGFSPQEFEPTLQTFFSIIHPDDIELINTSYHPSASQNTDIHEIEHRIVQKHSGEIRHVYEKFEHVRDSSGKAVHSFGMIHDITERKHSAEKFAEHSAMLAAILESTSDSVFSLDRNYCYTSFNKAHARNMRSLYNAEIKIGHSLFEYQTVAEDRERAQKNIDRVLSGEQIFSLAFSGEPDLKRSYFEIAHHPIFNESEEIIGVSIFSQDITERTLAENKIIKLNETLEQRVAERTSQLEAMNRKLAFRLNEIEQFTYIASHDLQEPLRSLTTFTQLVQNQFSGKLGGDGNEYIRFIYNSANRMRELVTGLLNYSLLGKEGIKTHVDCYKLVGAVASDLDGLIRENKVKLEIAELPSINGYAAELKLLFHNLINNAIKFQRKGIPPEIKVFAELQPDQVLFSVADNGIGIEEKNREKIFIIFKRMHNRDEYEGTGIGLAHCKKIIELHGGRIWVDRNKNAGSVFRFTIPMASDTPSSLN